MKFRIPFSVTPPLTIGLRTFVRDAIFAEASHRALGSCCWWGVENWDHWHSKSGNVITYLSYLMPIHFGNSETYFGRGSLDKGAEGF